MVGREVCCFEDKKERLWDTARILHFYLILGDISMNGVGIMDTHN